MNTKRNAETIRKEYEMNGERGGALTRVREYARIARGMGLNDFDLYYALDYIFDKIEDVYNGNISRAIYNAAFSNQ